VSATVFNSKNRSPMNASVNSFQPERGGIGEATMFSGTARTTEWSQVPSSPRSSSLSLERPVQ
jgi:hypothetical protein